MRSVLAYAHRPGPLAEAGAIAATAFLLVPVAIAFASSNPIVLAGAGLAAALAGWAAGASRAVRAALRWALALGALIVIVNALASQRGETILVRGWDLPALGRIDVSAEALAEGGVLALRIAVVLVAFAVHTACVNPDELLRLVRPLARRSALTASLITRMTPLAARDHARLREAAALRGPAASRVDRLAIVRRLVGGALDRAVDSAATLELRGYAVGGGGGVRSHRRRSRHGRAFLAAALAMLAVVVAGRLTGLGGFDAYPLISIDAGAATVALALVLPVLAAAPFSLEWWRSRAPTARARSQRGRGGAVSEPEPRARIGATGG
jgi:energy-coupling factor transport system permease protein